VPKVTLNSLVAGASFRPRALSQLRHNLNEVLKKKQKKRYPGTFETAGTLRNKFGMHRLISKERKVVNVRPLHFLNYCNILDFSFTLLVAFLLALLV